jgi:hypothetical protein
MSPLRAALIVIVAVAAAACSSQPTPTAPPTPVPVPASVSAFQAWLVEHTFTCDPVGVPGPGGVVWTCSLDMAPETAWRYPEDQRRFSVEITATSAGVTRVVAVLDHSRSSAPPDPNIGIGFLAETIGASPLTGDSGPELMDWAYQHWRGGGTLTVGSVTMHLGPFGVVTRGELDFNPPA